MTTTIKKLAFGILSLFAVYGCQSDTQDAPAPPSDDQLVGFAGSVDHAAIVEGTTVMLTTDQNLTVLDAALDTYNQEDPFRIGPGFRETFAANLIKFDASDGKRDWTPAQSAIWIDRLSTSKGGTLSRPTQDEYMQLIRLFSTISENSSSGKASPACDRHHEMSDLGAAQ